MFAVEVKDAHDRVVPITDNKITFKVSGEGKLIGVGNGDPTDQDPDKGTSRKAFCGYCMAVVQSTRKGGNITVEASAPGLESARATVNAKTATLRPQVEIWERDVPQGAGVTGLWRETPAEGEQSEIMAFIAGSGAVYSFKHDGSSLTGTVEGASVNFTGGMDVPAPIVNGKVSGDAIEFKVGGNSLTGTIKGERIELQRTINLGWAIPKTPEKAPDAPDIGPAPDGSDPSSGDWNIPSAIPVVLKRAKR
jgi:beta-galactosidase